MPVPVPVTAPDVPTVAIAVFSLFHVPPGFASVNDVVRPVQTVSVPVIGLMAGDTSTETTAVAYAVPQAFATV